MHVDIDSTSTAINRAIDLLTIINNIKIKDSYYQTVDMEYSLSTDSHLYQYIQNN
jgi:hypothetical protein